MKLYALLIGINEYHKDSLQNIPTLQACLNDVAAMKTFLMTYYKDMIPDRSQIQVLENEQATKANVIKGFKNHLCQAQEGDVALVFYSGHGSTGITAPEFQKFTTDNQEQTWVLYDSRTRQGDDLADKEIAILLEDIGRKSPQIVVIADSCHSGSITRDAEEYMQLRARFMPGKKEARSLESYLNGAYLKRADLTIPDTEHLLISACDRTQRAWEVEKSGVFTQFLLSVLEKTGGQIWYYDLFVQTRVMVQGKITSQTPKLEARRGFNPRIGFLGRLVEGGKMSRLPIKFNNRDNVWKIKLGIADGIQPNFEGDIKIKIYEHVSGGDAVTNAILGYINVNESELRVQNKHFLIKEKDYWGEPIALPLAPFFIYTRSNAIISALGHATESGIYCVENRKICRFEVTEEEGNIKIYDTQTKIMVQGVKGIGSESIQTAVQILKKLAGWHRILELHNQKTKMNVSKAEFTILIEQDDDEIALSDSTITLNINDNKIPFEAKFTNKTGEPLYATLLYITPEYGIEVLYENSQPVLNKKDVTLYQKRFYLKHEDEEIVDTFKLILSTEEIESSLFSQDDFELGEMITPAAPKSIDRRNTRSIHDDSDWFTKTIAVRLVRQSNVNIGLQQRDLPNGVSIKTHPTFKSLINWSALIPKTRSLDTLPINNEFFKHNPYFEIVDFAENPTLDESILELSDIEGAETLTHEPLKIVINPQNTEGVIVPMFYDGRDFLPAGNVTLEERQIIYNVSHIPKDIGTVKTRSLKTATRLVFIKFANKISYFGKTEELRWVDYNDNGVRKDVDLNAKIKKANKILLLTHGIIGDTEEMAKVFKMAIDEKGYDLVLTYDYENLNTTIQENSRILLETLQRSGFGENDGKELVIIAHSMGGLVTRYMIEHLGGDRLVDKLIMAGTPNGGSKFGALPVYIGWLANILGIGTILFPDKLPSAAATFFKITKAIALISLEEMSPSSTFIKNLALGTPSKVPYIVLGGNLDKYLEHNEDERSLMDKALTQLGDWVYKDEANDIAVSIDSIFKVNTLDKHPLACHHLNYFKIPESIEALKRAIG